MHIKKALLTALSSSSAGAKGAFEGVFSCMCPRKALAYLPLSFAVFAGCCVVTNSDVLSPTDKGRCELAAEFFPSR